MSKTIVYEVEVMFGDCDPAGIVFFPNYSKWMDGASLNFFRQCGLPPWRELKKTRGIIGNPLLEIHTSIIEWRDKVYIHRHVVKRGDEVLCEGTETRAFVIHPPEDPDRIKAIQIPEDIKAMCS